MDFDGVLFSNYRRSAQRFLAGCAGFKDAQLIIGPVASYGHCGAVDLIVSLAILTDEAVLEPGARIALSATSVHTWALIDVECLGSGG
jgi:hypothetical protein